MYNKKLTMNIAFFLFLFCSDVNAGSQNSEKAQPTPTERPTPTPQPERIIRVPTTPKINKAIQEQQKATKEMEKYEKN